jgi:ferredoxin-nitrate reductase
VTNSTTYKTTCCYCGVGCGILVSKDQRGQVKVTGDPDHPVNRGMLCSKGMNLHYTVMDQSDRLLYPELRKSRTEARQRAGWDEAMDHVAERFRDIIARHGPDAVGFYVSGQCLTEEYYVVNKLAKGFIGTNNIDTNSRLCMSSAVAAYKMSLGEDTVPGCYDDIERCDCFLIAGANPAWCHPILFRRLEAHKARNADVKIIVVDPRRTQTAAMADLHLQINPGTDVVLYNAIARGLIENGFIDTDFIARHTEGFEALEKQVMKLTLREAAAICGIQFTEIYRAVKYIGSSGGFISMWAMGLNQSAVGVNKNLALINLSLITGKIGKPGCGPFSLTGQPNAMGGREVGGMANLLPAHRDLGNAAQRQEVADFWKVARIPDKPGLTATEMFDALHKGRLKAIWIICTNPLVSMPEAHKIEEALQQAELVVVQDISGRADTLQYADVVLPAAGWLEKEGTMTNSERRISYLPRVMPAPGEALPDTDILLMFARKMGWEHAFTYPQQASIYEEHAALTKGTHIDVSGLNYGRLQEEGTMQWPVPAAASAGTPRLFADGNFYRPTGKAKLFALKDAAPAEPVSPEFPLVLTTGRVRDHWHTMTKTGKVGRLAMHVPKPVLEIHPADAEKLEIRTGDPVIVANPRGEVRVTAQLTPDIKRGVVFLPMHWGKVLNRSFARANNLTATRVDPVSKEPDFKFSAVQVKKFEKPPERIVIIGSGPACYRFLCSYRALNTEDEITVLCNGATGFSNPAQWAGQLQGAVTDAELAHLQFDKVAQRLKVSIKNNTSISIIEREKQYVKDAAGHRYAYDRLILTADEKTTVDISTLKTRLRKGDTAVVQGSGKTELELALALQHMGVSVSIVTDEERLLQQHVDATTAQLLTEILAEKGITVICGNSGRQHPGAIQVAPCPHTLDLAAAAGLRAGTGITVNEYLQTDDPHIYAIGRTAAYEGQATGVASLWEKQADVLARYFYGDQLSYYKDPGALQMLEIPALELCVLGDTRPQPDAHEVVLLDHEQRYYKKCIVQHDKLIGAILLGDAAEAAEFRKLIAERTELVEKRSLLLRPGAGGKQAVLGRLVCTCKDVGEENILQAVKNGCKTVTDICSATGAGTGCGSCRPELKMILEKAR